MKAHPQEGEIEFAVTTLFDELRPEPLLADWQRYAMSGGVKDWQRKTHSDIHPRIWLTSFAMALRRVQLATALASIALRWVANGAKRSSVVHHLVAKLGAVFLPEPPSPIRDISHD
jgi:hypothetical protein